MQARAPLFGMFAGGWADDDSPFMLGSVLPVRCLFDADSVPFEIEVAGLSDMKIRLRM